MLITKAPKGTKDILPTESYRWQYIEKKIREVCALYNVKEVRVPSFEHTELFLRSVGDTTDIVNKEMYTFEDKGGRSITLKPEGTAGVGRCFVQNSIYAGPMPVKMYYLNSPVFRYERPQAGRLREHHQFGVEMFGSDSPTVDAEVIAIAMHVFENMGVGNLVLNINSIGCKECRPNYNKALKDYLDQSIDSMCASCKDRYERNPLRILDCKNPSCQTIVDGAPTTLDFLCETCDDHFHTLQSHLKALQIEYTINPLIVRGLDYYTRTVFEIITTSIGAQGTVCGGGRYNDLVEEIGGPATPAIGFGMGMERLLMVMENDQVDIPQDPAIDVYIASLGEACAPKMMEIAGTLRGEGFIVETTHVQRSLKAQMKYANKLGCRFVAIIGEDELKDDEVMLKSMQNKDINQRVKCSAIQEYLK